MIPRNPPPSLWPTRLPADDPARAVERYEPVTYTVMHRELESAVRQLGQAWHPTTPGAVQHFQDLERACQPTGPDHAWNELTEVRHSLWYLRQWITQSEPADGTPQIRAAFDDVRNAAFDLSSLHALPSRHYVVRPAIWAIPNFHPVVPGLYRGGQPTQAGVDWLAAHGFKGEVDLRGSDVNNAWGDSPVWPSNIARLPLPVEDLQCPTLPQVLIFKRWLEDPEHQPAILHCKGGIGRSSGLVAEWSITQGLTADEALEVENILPESLAQTAAIRQFETDWKAWVALHPEDAPPPGARERLLAARRG